MPYRTVSPDVDNLSLVGLRGLEGQERGEKRASRFGGQQKDGGSG